MDPPGAEESHPAESSHSALPPTESPAANPRSADPPAQTESSEPVASSKKEFPSVTAGSSKIPAEDDEDEKKKKVEDNDDKKEPEQQLEASPAEPPLRGRSEPAKSKSGNDDEQEPKEQLQARTFKNPAEDEDDDKKESEQQSEASPAKTPLEGPRKPAKPKSSNSEGKKPEKQQQARPAESRFPVTNKPLKFRIPTRLSKPSPSEPAPGTERKFQICRLAGTPMKPKGVEVGDEDDEDEDDESTPKMTFKEQLQYRKTKLLDKLQRCTSKPRPKNDPEAYYDDDFWRQRDPTNPFKPEPIPDSEKENPTPLTLGPMIPPLDKIVEEAEEEYKSLFETKDFEYEDGASTSTSAVESENKSPRKVAPNSPPPRRSRRNPSLQFLLPRSKYDFAPALTIEEEEKEGVEQVEDIHSVSKNYRKKPKPYKIDHLKTRSSVKTDIKEPQKPENGITMINENTISRQHTTVTLQEMMKDDNLPCKGQPVYIVDTGFPSIDKKEGAEQGHYGYGSEICPGEGWVMLKSLMSPPKKYGIRMSDVVMWQWRVILAKEELELIRPLTRILIFNLINYPTNKVLKELFAEKGISAGGVNISRSPAPGAVNRVYHILRKTPIIRGIDYMLKDYAGCDELNKCRKRIRTIKIRPENEWKGDAKLETLVHHIQLELEDVDAEHWREFDVDEAIANEKPSKREKMKNLLFGDH